MQQHQRERHNFLTLVRAFLHVWTALSLACCWKLYFLLLLLFFYEWIRGGAMHLYHKLYHVWEHCPSLRCGKNLHATPEKPPPCLLTPRIHSSLLTPTPSLQPVLLSFQPVSSGLAWGLLTLADPPTTPHTPLLSLSLTLSHHCMNNPGKGRNCRCSIHMIGAHSLASLLNTHVSSSRGRAECRVCMWERDCRGIPALHLFVWYPPDCSGGSSSSIPAFLPIPRWHVLLLPAELSVEAPGFGGGCQLAAGFFSRWKPNRHGWQGRHTTPLTRQPAGWEQPSR